MTYSGSLPDRLNTWSIAFVLLTISILPDRAHADLSDLKVYSPIVEKGEFGFEVLGNTTIDGKDELGGFHYHEFEFEYGVLHGVRYG